MNHGVVGFGPVCLFHKERLLSVYYNITFIKSKSHSIFEKLQESLFFPFENFESYKWLFEPMYTMLFEDNN